MRKHFLILMLLTLLPFTAWAVGEEPQVNYPVDISEGWAIEIVGAPTPLVYDGSDLTPVVRLVNATTQKYIPAEKLNISWNVTDRVNVPSVGYFEARVTPNGAQNGTYGNFDKKSKIYVLKAELQLDNNEPAPALANGRQWNGQPLTLVDKLPILTEDFDGAAKVKYSIDDKQTWSETVPTATLPGTYVVWYKVDGTSNYTGIDATKIGNNVVITGVNLTENTDYTAPQAIGDLAFVWENGAAKDLALITAGSVTNIDQQTTPKGTMKYKYRLQTNPASEYSEYSTAIPTANAAGIYDVMWKIFPTENTGFIAEEAAQALVVEIDAIEPETVTSATGKTGLKYLGDGVAPQELLASAGTATDGATPKYQIRRKDIGGVYPNDFDDPVEYADVTGSKAGVYEIKTIVPAGGNYTAKAAESTIEVTIAQIDALTSAPTAISNLVWNAQPQVLIAAGEGTVPGKVLYKKTANATPAPAADAEGWKPVVDDADLKGSDAGTYNVWYQVKDKNYKPVVPTLIGTATKPVKIAPKTVSIVVNNRSKTYDGTGDIDALDQVAAKFSVSNTVDNKPVSVAGLLYTNEGVGLGDNYKNVGTYVGALTTTAQAVAGIQANQQYGENYEYLIVPGNLTINPRPLTVTANDDLTAKYGDAYDISKGFTITGTLEANDGVDASNAANKAVVDKYFSTWPILTTEAIAMNPEVGEYALHFTAGTTTANYTMNLTVGDNNDGYVIGDRVFEVTVNANRKVVITVLPHTQKYTGVAESWDNMQPGKDYVVTGLIQGDALKTLPTFTRSESNKFDVKIVNNQIAGYDLIASGAAVNNELDYPGGIVYNNSTFTIEPVELTATVNAQTIYRTADPAVALAGIDQTAWNVTGMVNDEPLTKLGGSLAITEHAQQDDDFAVINTAAVYAKGILLAITNKNYTLKANTQYGELRVINAGTIELNDTKDVTEALKNANNRQDIPITFNSRKLKKDTWNTLILPFDIKVRDLSNKLGYAVVDMLDESNTDPSKVIFKITTGTIKANTPFMIKTDAEVDLQSKFFQTDNGANPEFIVKIAYTDATTGEVADKAGNKLTGAYKSQTVNVDEYYMNGSGNWKLCGEAFELKGERVKFTKASATSAAPIFYIEEGDGTMTVINGETTSIETISAEKLNAAEGWYTLNGVKLQGVPTQKGIYINNGKKVVIK